MFSHNTRIYLHHTDAAGRLFYPNQFLLMQEAKEELISSLDLPMNRLLDHPDFTFPIVHAEADYKSILKAGDRVRVEAAIEKIGVTSVICAFKIFKDDGTLAGTGRTVNVCVAKLTWQKSPLPEEWRLVFEKAQNRCLCKDDAG